jgi:hypothetical protein
VAAREASPVAIDTRPLTTPIANANPEMRFWLLCMTLAPRCRAIATEGPSGTARSRISLCPGGKERMRRLMSIVAAKRFPFRDLVTHPFRLAEIETAYDLFSHQRDGVMNVAIRP